MEYEKHEKLIDSLTAIHAKLFAETFPKEYEEYIKLEQIRAESLHHGRTSN